jgi:ketosteroid isomerase-like protein
MEQTRLTSTTLKAIERFHAAFNRQDLAAVMALMTSDCIFENTTPPPDGARYVGQAAVRNAFADFFRSSPHAKFEVEELFVVEDRGVLRWTYTWRNANNTPGYVRGVDVYRVRNGKIAEKYAYVKG